MCFWVYLRSRGNQTLVLLLIGSCCVTYFAKITLSCRRRPRCRHRRWNYPGILSAVSRYRCPTSICCLSLRFNLFGLLVKIGFSVEHFVKIFMYLKPNFCHLFIENRKGLVDLYRICASCTWDIYFLIQSVESWFGRGE